MNGMMGVLGGQAAQSGAQTPPPVPQAGYHVAVNGVATGLFSLATLSQMEATRSFTSESLVWKQGMVERRRAGDVDEPVSVFGGTAPSNIPPIPPIA